MWRSGERSQKRVDFGLRRTGRTGRTSRISGEKDQLLYKYGTVSIYTRGKLGLSKFDIGLSERAFDRRPPHEGSSTILGRDCNEVVAS
jgi:hypothetical protein